MTMYKTLRLEDFRDIEETIKNQCGDQIMIGYMKGDVCHTYISPKITDMNECYIIDSFRIRRIKSSLAEES